MALVFLYAWTLAAGAISAPALALLGVHLATRDRAMQTMCVSQGAMVGVLCGIGFFHGSESAWVETLAPFLTALLASALTFVATDLIVVKKTASKNTQFAFVFALLLASGYLVGSMFPALESHMAQIYFGDLATLTESNSQVTIGMSLICLLTLFGFSRLLSNQSFEWAVFGDVLPGKSRALGLRVFQVVSLGMLCLSVQFLGFLFTIAMLFLPTALMSFQGVAGLRRHQTFCAMIAVVGTLMGFLLSLRYTRLPTVPAIVGVMFIFGLIVLGLEKFFISWRKSSESAHVIDRRLGSHRGVRDGSMVLSVRESSKD